MTRYYAIFADYHQFYLWDHGTAPDAPTDYTDDDIARRIKVAPFVVVIQPARNCTVPVEIEVIGARPEERGYDEWDHVAEASLDLPSGRLEIHECTGGSIDILPLDPGTYRVRAYFAGLGTVGDDGLDGDDRYRVVLWPEPSAPLQVLKEYPD